MANFDDAVFYVGVFLRHSYPNVTLMDRTFKNVWKDIRILLGGNYFIENTLQRLNDRDNHLGSTGTTPLCFLSVESESLAFCAKTILRIGQLPDINKIKAIANILV